MKDTPEGTSVSATTETQNSKPYILQVLQANLDSPQLLARYFNLRRNGNPVEDCSEDPDINELIDLFNDYIFPKDLRLYADVDAYIASLQPSQAAQKLSNVGLNDAFNAILGGGASSDSPPPLEELADDLEGWSIYLNGREKN